MEVNDQTLLFPVLNRAIHESACYCCDTQVEVALGGGFFRTNSIEPSSGRSSMKLKRELQVYGQSLARISKIQSNTSQQFKKDAKF